MSRAESHVQCAPTCRHRRGLGEVSFWHRERQPPLCGFAAGQEAVWPVHPAAL